MYCGQTTLNIAKTLVKKNIDFEFTCVDLWSSFSVSKKKFVEIWCLLVASFFSGYLAFYFIKMLIISYIFQERSEGADEILIWIPQTSVAIGSSIFFISCFHQFILSIIKK